MTRQLILYSAISIVSVTIILGSIYYWLGGFDEVNVYELQGQEKTLIGKYFKGRRNSTLVVDYLNECRKLVEDSIIVGTVTRVVYKNESLARNEAEYFIGVDVSGDMAQAPLGYQFREYASSKRFAVFLSMNHWVRPSSSTIDRMLSEEAQSKGMELGDKIFELYYYDDSMSIEGWVNVDQ